MSVDVPVKYSKTDVCVYVCFQKSRSGCGSVVAVWRSFPAVEWDTYLGSSIPTHFLEAVAPCLPGSCCTCCMSCNGKIKTHQNSAYKNLTPVLVEYKRMQLKFKRHIFSSSRKQNGAHRAVWLRWIAPPSGCKWLLIIYIGSLKTKRRPAKLYAFCIGAPHFNIRIRCYESSLKNTPKDQPSFCPH